MIRRSITQAKGELSALVEQAIKGEELILSRFGRPVVRIIAIDPDTRTREPGGISGAWIANDFDDENSAINALFESGTLL